MAVITISRQYGSFGDEIARQVCGAVGYCYFDKRVLERIASSMGLVEGEFVDFPEEAYHCRSAWERLLSSMVRRIPSDSLLQMTQEIPVANPNSQEYSGGTTATGVAMAGSWGENAAGASIKQLRTLNQKEESLFVRDVILNAYREGNFVIVGRGGQAILKGKPGVLHVRIIAPEDARAANLAAEQHLSINAAKKLIHEHDRAAADYIRTFYHANWDDPLLYHLIINTDTSTRDAAAQMIIAAEQRILESKSPAYEHGFRHSVWGRLQPQPARIAA